jgi:hypothetical protein
MGASNFSGLFNRNPDYFDGGAKEMRDSGTPAALDQYKLLKELAHQEREFTKAAVDAAASTATAETPFAWFSTYIKSVRAVRYIPAAALTASNTDYATLIIRSRNAAGTLVSIVAQVTTQITGSGNWAQRVPVVIPLHDGTNAIIVDGAKLDIPVGGFLTFEITKTGSGVAVPAGVLSALVL